MVLIFLNKHHLELINYDKENDKCKNCTIEVKWLENIKRLKVGLGNWYEKHSILRIFIVLSN